MSLLIYVKCERFIMANSISGQSSYQQIPSYSGVTINVTNPAMTVLPNATGGYAISGQPLQTVPNGNLAILSNDAQGNGQYPLVGQGNGFVQAPYCTHANPNCMMQNQSYPPQYYMNNYNYAISGEGNKMYPGTENLTAGEQSQNYANITPQEANLDKSQSIINDLDARDAAEKDLEKNGVQTKVVALTDEYIMSLENYLNNPNKDIRLMAAKEILTRLDEDKSRYDDAALNALLNKMLQDPAKLIRTAALSAFVSGLASGNDYTIELLNKIQADPNADPEDVLNISQFLLQRSTSVETRYTPQENLNQQQEVIQDELSG